MIFSRIQRRYIPPDIPFCVLYGYCRTRGIAQASPPPKMRERVRKRFSRPLSSENMPPLPGTTSMINWVCFQTSNWLPLI